MKIKIENYSFNKLIEDTCTLIGVMNKDWVFEKINQPWTDVLLYEEEEIINHSFDYFFNDKEDVEKLKRILSHKKIIQGQLINLMTKDGQPCWLKCNLGFDKDKILILALDISEDVFTSETLDHVSDIVLFAAWSYNPKIEKISWSKELYKILDMSPDSTIERNTLINAIHPSYLKIYNKASQELYDDKKGYDITVKIISATGVEKWIHSITYPVVVNDEIVQVQGILKDVTKIQNALLETQELKDTMEMALKGMRSGYFVHNLIKDEVVYSKSFSDVIGINSRMMESKFRKLIHLDDVEEAYQRHVEGINVKHNHYHNHFRLKNPNGKFRHYEVHGWLIRNEEKKAVKLIGNLIDVDQRKQSQKKAKMYLNQVKTLVDNGKMSSILLDIEGNIQIADKTSAKVIRKEFGIDIQNKKTSFRDVVPTHLQEDLEEDFAKLKAGETIIKEVNHTGIDGKLRWFDAIFNPVKNSSNEIEGFVMNYINVTHRKKLMIELEQTKSKLLELNRLKSNIINNINHEIRTPLNGIMGAAELLNEVSSKEEQIELLEIQRESGERLLKTVDSIINYSLLDAEKQSFSVNEVDLKTVVQNCFDRFKHFADNNNVTYVLKNFDISVNIISDYIMLQQCLGNVIHNAIKFSEDGKVNVICLKANQIASIIVKDDGIGIESENHKRVFEYFEQESDGLNRAFEGAGMGLSFSKKFIEAIGGSISLESKRGVGSIFTLNVPFN